MGTRFVSLDFETTGAVPGWPNEPWQLGLVAVEDGVPVAGTQWETYFRVAADRPFSRRAPGRWAELRETLALAPTVMDAWPALSERLVGVPLVAHNAATERTMLTRQAPLTPWGPWIDTLRVVRKFWPILKSYALGDLIRTFGLEAQVREFCPDRTWHDALYDACAGAVLFCHVLKALKGTAYEGAEALVDGLGHGSPGVPTRAAEGAGRPFAAVLE
ncbi:MAG: exonuclease domain-containing protein [Kiritimatiellia bacterium]